MDIISVVQNKMFHQENSVGHNAPRLYSVCVYVYPETEFFYACGW